MPNFICTTCGTQHAESEQPPPVCAVCQDERQYVKVTGQQWTTLDKLRLLTSAGHDQSLRAWDTVTGREVQQLKAPSGALLARYISAASPTLAQAVASPSVAGDGQVLFYLCNLASLNWEERRLLDIRGLTPEEIERVLSCHLGPPQPPHTEEQAIEELAACLHKSGVSKIIIAQVFTAVRASEPPIRQALCYAIRGLGGDSGDEAGEKEIMAAIRGLSGNGSRPAETAPLPVGGRSGSPPA